MTERPFRHLCPEADLRDAMTDAEFWEHVAGNLGATEHFEDDYEADPWPQAGACPVCGEPGACGFDSEGRPLIHSTDLEVDE